MKVIIVGGVAGGATAAARIRRLDEHAEITVFERSGYISYANCGLPYYIGDVITDPEELTLQTPESFFKRFRINMKIHHEVISIHPDRKTVSVKNLENGEIFEENYDKLILSPGAKPTQPRLPGVGIDKLFTLRTVEDTFRIKEYINKNHPKSAVLAGGGFIGLELAENLRELGMDVTIVQRPKQLMNPFDPDMASMIHNEMRKHGIKLVLGYTVEGFKEKDNGVEVLLKDNPSLQADMVVLAIGVTPDTALAKEAGLELGIKESIVVNDRMETSVPDIYAAGDAVQVKHYVTGNDALISLAGPANKQGRIIADNICGGDSRYLGSQGSSVIKVFDMTAATTGINETNTLTTGVQQGTLHFVDLSPPPVVTEECRSLNTRQCGVHKYKGECSGVLAEDGARAVLTPAKENVRQNGRRMKEPEEPMFTITATDRHGILYHGRIRRLVPRECLRLQGYYDWQIDKIIDSTSDAQLYKQAGNGVTVNVIEAIGRLLQKADSELNTQKVSEKGIH